MVLEITSWPAFGA